ncbi:MAG: hypothetical protein KJ709_02070 [Nanoarchaeota archaeon]|nr:hypothetical protein [Nanoarchaeota archaeon]
MSYKIGEWKNSTLKTLQKLKKQNDDGNIPNASDFHNGAVSAWLVLLREAEYVNYDGRGYQINGKGLQLMHELEKNPPRVRKPRYRPIKSDGLSKNKNLYQVEVRGKNFYFQSEFSTSKERILKALAMFEEGLKK